MMHTRNHRPRIRSEKPFHTEKNHLDVMTEESIEQFLVFQQEERYSPETLKIHRRILHYLYDFLPEGKKFYKDALAEFILRFKNACEDNVLILDLFSRAELD